MGRAACRLLQREHDVRAHPRGRLRARRRSQTPRGAVDPLAFALRATPSIRRCPTRAPCATRHPCTTEDGFASGRPLTFELALSRGEAEMHAWTSYPEAKGPQPFGLLAGLPPSKAAEHPSVADLLPRRTEAPPPRLAWPVTPSFPGGEEPRLATQAGQGLRSRAYPRRSTFSRRPGCFLPRVAARVGGSPLAGAGRSLRHAARPSSGEGIAIGRPAPF